MFIFLLIIVVAANDIIIEENNDKIVFVNTSASFVTVSNKYYYDFMSISFQNELNVFNLKIYMNTVKIKEYNKIGDISIRIKQEEFSNLIVSKQSYFLTIIETDKMTPIKIKEYIPFRINDYFREIGIIILVITVSLFSGFVIYYFYNHPICKLCRYEYI